jgi:hypothetical protein
MTGVAHNPVIQRNSLYDRKVLKTVIPYSIWSTTPPIPTFVNAAVYIT